MLERCCTPHVALTLQACLQCALWLHAACTLQACPNVALTLWDNFNVKPNLQFVGEAFPKLERYLEWDRKNRGPRVVDLEAGNVSYLMRWADAGEGGMDHEQQYCPGNTYWTGGCSADHYALDATVYMIYESQATY